MRAGLQPLQLQPQEKIIFMKKTFLLSIIFFALFCASAAFAHQPNLIFLKQGYTQVTDPEISRAFYDELEGAPKDYFINSEKDFNLYINLLVPDPANKSGRYSAKIFLVEDDKETEIALIDGTKYDWSAFYEEFGRDWYLKGPELEKQVLAGKYKIEVFSEDLPTGQAGNTGKYVLAVGKTESFDAKSILNVYWQLPMLKIAFFKTSVLQFFLTPFGIGLIGLIGAIIIFVAFIYFIIGWIKETLKHNQAKTLLLTSAGMAMKEEIIKLLQRPAYDINLAFINTAYKYKLEEDPYYVNEDLKTLRELGFNVQEIDIDGKKEAEIMNLLKIKDIIFVAGGNTFYLLKSMRSCKFEKVLRRLLKDGIVYIGSSAGSIVAGKTIQTAGWLGDNNNVRLKNIKGLSLVNFDIFCHYQPELDEVIKKNMKNPRKRQKKLRIITDEQAILVQGREVALIGKGEEIVI